MIYKPALYIVSTPIGNLQDISLRALETLQKSDVIFCEDTRVSHKLLEKHNISARLKLYNDNSDANTRAQIKDLIKQGKIVSLVSDAGTPLISDPGYKLVRELKSTGLAVDVVPGACAAVTALSISGLATDKFIFMGFMPKTQEGKRKSLKEVDNINCTAIFYETANRLISTLQCIAEELGDREVNVARELTKLHQESRLGSAVQLIEHYEQKPPKGEIVLCISGKKNLNISEDAIKIEASQLLEEGLTAKSIALELFAKYNEFFSKKDLYKIVNDLKNN